MPTTPQFHFGTWLRRQIEATGLSRRAFAEAHQLSSDTVNKWIAQQCPGMRGYQVVRLSRALSMSREEVEHKLELAEGGAAHEPAAA